MLTTPLLGLITVEGCPGRQRGGKHSSSAARLIDCHKGMVQADPYDLPAVLSLDASHHLWQCIDSCSSYEADRGKDEV